MEPGGHKRALRENGANATAYAHSHPRPATGSMYRQQVLPDYKHFVMAKIRAGIIGGAGYTGGEMIRILINHPAVEIAFVHSKSNAGKPLYAVHEDLAGETDQVFAAQWNTEIDVIFLCIGHGEAKKFLNEHGSALANVKLIDLSQDYRLHNGGQRP